MTLRPEEVAALEASPECLRCRHREMVHYDGEDYGGGCNVTGCMCGGIPYWRGFAECETEAWERLLHPKPLSPLEQMWVNMLREMLCTPLFTLDISQHKGKIIRFTNPKWDP